MRIGVISDTHGLLRAEALLALTGVEHILHAGDVGDFGILARLAQIAPVTAIRGNVDTHGDCARLPATEVVQLAGRVFYLVHSVHDLEVKPEVAGIDVVVSGHSHKPGVQTRKGVDVSEPGERGAQAVFAAGVGGPGHGGGWGLGRDDCGSGVATKVGVAFLSFPQGIAFRFWLGLWREPGSGLCAAPLGTTAEYLRG